MPYLKMSTKNKALCILGLIGLMVLYFVLTNVRLNPYIDVIPHKKIVHTIERGEIVKADTIITFKIKVK